MKDCGEIESFTDFYNMYRGHQHSNFIYRGENAPNYTLKPKYGRYDLSEAPDDFEKTILRHFKTRGAPFITKLPENDWDWLALGQHFGLATRLLDWSQNPLVALYFAVQEFEIDRDRVIYALDTESLIQHENDTSPFELDNISICMPRHIDNRITAQQGLFTCHPNPPEEFDHPGLEKWTVKSNSVIELSVEIDTLGFNDATMFPGLQGIAGHINEWHLREIL